MSVPDLESLLTKYFNLESFRKGQKAIIESILSKKDALAVMPTGGGKSLCYQLPSIVSPGIVVVVSPLISLMEDQVRKLKQLGIAAGFLHSGQKLAAKKSVFSELKKERNFILYLSPERVQKPGFSQWISKQKLSLFAIDEAHCVSSWGPDFREDYYKLRLLRELRPDVPILALTASATPEVLRDITKQLNLQKPDRHIHGFYRPNLYFQVEHCTNDQEKLALLRQALGRHPVGRILVYCGTRKQCEELTEEFKSEFPDIGTYHAGIQTDERTRIQKDYEVGKIRILAATNAFGMGVDHPDVRLVVHFQMPANIENYYQEMGRAGRDGKPSTCLLLYSKRDKGLHAYFITQSQANKATIRQRWTSLDTIVQFAEGGECRHSGILTYFRDSFRIKACGHCDICDSARKISRGVSLYKPKVSSLVKRSQEHKRFEDTPLSPEEELRYEVLREWRKDYAEQNDIAAFMVFSNKTLRDLVRKNPKTLDQLRKVYGFGEHKTEHLGSLLIEQLRTCGSMRG